MKKVLDFPLLSTKVTQNHRYQRSTIQVIYYYSDERTLTLNTLHTKLKHIAKSHNLIYKEN